MKDLIAGLRSPDESKADKAAQLLAKRRDPACMDAVLPLTLSADIDVMSRALFILSRFLKQEDDKIWDFMSPKLSRGDRGTQLAVLCALEDLPIAQALPALKTLAGKRDLEVKTRAIACLISMARIHPGSRKALSKLFMSAATSRSPLVRAVGLEGLYELQDLRYARILLKAEKDPVFEIRLRYPNYLESIEALRARRLDRRDASKK